MPVTDKYNEVLLGVIAGVVILLVVASVVVFNLLYYQKRRFQHLKKITAMEKAFSEELLKSQLEIQEHTFNQISEEIHDNVGQVLSLARVQLNIINESNKADPRMLMDVKENVGKALADLRDIARSLSGSRIKSLGINALIAQEAERINKLNIIRVTVVANEIERSMDDRKKLILFRIFQECLQNIIKHANASEVLITTNFSPDSLQIVIKDNGKGFDTKKTNPGLGLANIMTRAALAGGQCAIESITGHGTIVTIDMPYE